MGMDCARKVLMRWTAAVVATLLAMMPAAFAAAPRAKIVYADDHQYPPFTFLDDDGLPAGFNVDLMRAIARRIGMEVEVRLEPWPKVREGLERTRSVDISAMFFFAERDRHVDYAMPHAIVTHEVFIRRNSPAIQTLEEMAGRQVVVQQGAFIDDYLRTHWPDIDLIYADSEPEALRLLASGQGDATIAGQAAGFHLLDHHGLSNLTASGVPLLPVNYAFVVQEGQSELLDQINQGLARVRASGEYAELYRKWFGPRPRGVTFATVARYVAAVLLPLIAVTVGVLLWNRSLKRQVAQRTRQLEGELTERQQAERSLRTSESQLKAAKESAEQANRTKDHFLAVLSHELRTPLTPVLTAVTAELQKSTSPQLRGTFEMIQRNVELEARLIDDLLDLTRLMRGRMVLNLETVDAHAQLRQALDVCAGAIEEKLHRIDCDLGAARHHLRADPVRLKQVFWNLIQNAAKFSPPGSELRVRTRNGPDSTFEVEVADNGIGMEPDVIGRIFHPFEQAESAISRRYGGLGLGLSISRAIAEAHGGSITARSLGAGRGSTFTVTLPSVAAPAESAPAVPASPDAPASLRILLVEDSTDTLHILTRLLKAGGHSVVTADSAVAARRHWETGAFDLLISDIGLPDGNGIDLLTSLRKGAPVRAIAISGYGMEDDIARSREAGFAEHLVKPLDYARLEEAIARVAAAPLKPQPARA